MDDETLKRMGMLQKRIAESSSVDKVLQSFASQRSAIDKAMAALARPSAIDMAIKSFASQQSAIDKAMAAISMPSAIDKAIQSFASQQSAIDKAIAAMARPSNFDLAIQSVLSNPATLKGAVTNFASAGSTILSEPSWLSEIVSTVSNINLDDVEIESIENDLAKASSELKKVDSRASFLNTFSNFHPFIQAILFYFLIQILLPQINSISANLLTPIVESYLHDNELPSRQKIKDIKNLPLSLKGVSTDDLRFITGDDVRLRASPSTKSEILDELILGQVVTVLSKSRNWLEIMYEYEDGESISGWVFTRFTANFVK